MLFLDVNSDDSKTACEEAAELGEAIGIVTMEDTEKVKSISPQAFLEGLD